MFLLLGLVLVAFVAPWEGYVGHVNAQTAPLHSHALFGGDKIGSVGDIRANTASEYAQVWIFRTLLSPTQRWPTRFWLYCMSRSVQVFWFYAYMDDTSTS